MAPIHNAPEHGPTTLLFLYAENIADGFNIRALADSFVKWKYEGYWSANGKVFDIGNTTSKAISKLEIGYPPSKAGSTAENENGNGSLMRIAPLAPYLLNVGELERYKIIRKVSSITHAHIRSVTACIIFVEYLRLINLRFDPIEAWSFICNVLPKKLKRWGVPDDQLNHFSRLFRSDIAQIPEDEIKSDGYVVHTLEAAFWCLFTSEDYSETVLKAVNLGSDTDTTASVAGALAGIIYGYHDIPPEWHRRIARTSDITDLSGRMDFNLRPKE